MASPTVILLTTVLNFTVPVEVEIVDCIEEAKEEISGPVIEIEIPADYSEEDFALTKLSKLS